MKKILFTSLFTGLLLAALCAGTILAQISFTSDINNVCAPITVTFTNTSTDPDGYQYQWNFGDGSPAVYDTLTTTISHSYNNSGNFYVQLYVYDSLGGYQGNSGLSLYILGAPTTFYLSKNSACPNEKITVSINGAFSSVLWDFGDGFTATGTYYDHIYDSTGSFIITVITTNSCGTDTLTKSITINGNLYINSSINLSVYPSTICPNEYTNLSTASGYLYYLWDYGDGNTDSATWGSKSHKYADTGTYTVSVTIVNGCGNDTVLTGSVSVEGNLKITSSISVNPSPNPSCPYDAVQFSSSSGYYSYLWNFGDGGTAAYYYTSHSYLDTGIYNISLTVMNGCGDDTTLYRTVTIQDNLNMTGFVSLSASPNPVCPGDKLNFYTSSGYSSYMWNFGDGNQELSNSYTSHIYSAPGSYTASITIINGCGEDTTKSTVINVQNGLPMSGFFSVSTYPNPVCTGDSTQISTSSNYSEYIWDFGDGNADTTLTYRNWHAYSAAGDYNAQVTVVNGCGNDTTLAKTITVSDSGIYSLQDIALQIGPDTVCPGDLADFEAGYLYNASWSSAVLDFGDGNSANYYHGQNEHIKHSFSSANTYTVSLTVTNSCGYDTIVYGTIVVLNGLNPDPNNYSVNANPYYTCLGSGTGFTVWGPKADSYLWDFGDGATLTTDTFIASHTYLTSGTFDVLVTIQNSCGNSIVETTSVTVDVCTSISFANESISGTMMVFPNPFNQSAILHLQNSDWQKRKNISLEIFDVFAKRIMTVPVSGQNTILSRKEIESGIYFLRLKDGNNTFTTQKIIVQ